jgi:hypothetical protein
VSFLQFFFPLSSDPQKPSGFQLFLQSFFPRRWLNTKAPANIRLFGGLGRTLDVYFDFAKSLVKETRINTAIDTLPFRELEYGIKSDPSLSLEARRGNILARKRESGGAITKDELISTIKAAYGIDVSIENNLSECTMTIHVDTLGPPDCLAQMQAYIESSCRAHVGKVFEFKYLRINEINQVMNINQLQATPINHFQGGVNA